MSPPPCAKKLPSLARIIIRLRRFQSAGETERAHGGKKSQQNIFNLCCVPDEKKRTKNRNEKAEAERKVLQCGLSYDGAFSFAKKVLWRYHSMVMVYKSNSIVIHTIVPNDY